jgi:hypothetical protein
MPARRCPHCSLVNPGSAQNCDCGYSFVTNEAPHTRNTGDPVGRWVEKQDAVTQRFIVRIGVFGLVLLFGIGIAMCGGR